MPLKKSVQRDLQGFLSSTHKEQQPSSEEACSKMRTRADIQRLAMALTKVDFMGSLACFESELRKALLDDLNRSLQEMRNHLSPKMETL